MYILGTSSVLVNELKMRDKLCQEVSAQNSLISQLVKLQKTDTPPKGSPVRIHKEPLIV